MPQSQFKRPEDAKYYAEPWSTGYLQGDIFTDVPLAFAAPPDAIVIAEGERRFITGPFDAGPAMLLSPSCAIAAQGKDVPEGAYSHAARVMAPIRPIEQLLDAGVITEKNIDALRADKLRNYLYLPPGKEWPESVALLYLPITVHHDVIKDLRTAQLTGEAYWHLRIKLMFFYGSFLLDPGELGQPPEPTEREN